MQPPLVAPPLLLYDLPDVAVYAIYMLGAALLAVLTCRLVAPRLPLPEDKAHIDMAMRTTAAVVSALTLTLAFCAIQARTQLAEAQRVVSVEVSAIGGMARLADRIGPPGAALHAGLLAYLRSIAEQEFPTMADHGRHPETQRLAEAVEHAAYAAAAAGLSDVMAQDLLQQADDLDTAREERLRHAADGLPSAFWMLIRLLMLLLLATGALYPPKGHVLAMLGIQAAGVAALIAFVFLMDQPFRGTLSVSPAPYRTLIQGATHRAEVAAAVRRGLMVAQPPPSPGAARLAGDDPQPPRP
ncbi:bestrophin-like domain [Falsiroseomonas tokyonensis]|uniref:DUF4239 domain-containing protein n=1 Tax=Falsiroseomonas tokyonensis TaxID=430521 RepID=A0ABV7BUA8_9PROT|nr:hypothetical protein [Falsiroseomonas tokyonensis]MBU8538212.1 hypothetical protein [Falsiroseomonas tokyonensis]